MTNLIAFPRSAPPPAAEPARFAVGNRVRCRTTARAGTVIMARDQCVFTVRLDAVDGHSADVVRGAASLEHLSPACDRQVVAYLPGTPGRGRCLVTQPDGSHRWVREDER